MNMTLTTVRAEPLVTGFTKLGAGQLAMISAVGCMTPVWTTFGFLSLLSLVVEIISSLKSKRSFSVPENQAECRKTRSTTGLQQRSQEDNEQDHPI